MRFKLLSIIVALLAVGTAVEAVAQATNDTIYNPKIVFSGMPQKYELAGIKVTGVDNYEDYIIIGYSGLSVGQKIEIPGDEIKMAAKRFWRQQLFSSSKVALSITRWRSEPASGSVRSMDMVSPAHTRGIYF